MLCDVHVLNVKIVRESHREVNILWISWLGGADELINPGPESPRQEPGHSDRLVYVTG